MRLIDWSWLWLKNLGFPLQSVVKASSSSNVGKLNRFFKHKSLLSTIDVGKWIGNDRQWKRTFSATDWIFSITSRTLAFEIASKFISKSSFPRYNKQNSTLISLFTYASILRLTDTPELTYIEQHWKPHRHIIIILTELEEQQSIRVTSGSRLVISFALLCQPAEPPVVVT